MNKIKLSDYYFICYSIWTFGGLLFLVNAIVYNINQKYIIGLAYIIIAIAYNIAARKAIKYEKEYGEIL
jgi:hypothetical protein